MLVNFNEMLSRAYKEKRAVGSFNVYNYETMRGVLDAAVEMGAKPVILAFGAKYLENMSLQDAYSMALSLSRQRDIPVCLHLDHCSDLDVVFQAIREGFGSVMYDGSGLPFEENMANTELVCRIAHACGVSVEAELGSIAAGEASHEGSADDREVYTDPASAREFVARTGVDALAVSIGTVHGLYKGVPNIRLDILEEINEALKKPLVLHGGSGIPEKTIHACIRGGVSKINVNTEMSSHAVSELSKRLEGPKLPHLSVLSLEERSFISDVVKKYIRFFEVL